jgi:hypothetical protein
MLQTNSGQYRVAQRLFLFIASLWVGSLITVGYLVAPTLFATLTDRQVAGMVAGAIFKAEAYISLVLCVGLLVLANLLVSRGLQTYRAIRWILLAMLICAAAGSFRTHAMDGKSARGSVVARYASEVFTTGRFVLHLTWSIKRYILDTKSLGHLFSMAS